MPGFARGKGELAHQMLAEVGRNRLVEQRQKKKKGRDKKERGGEKANLGMGTSGQRVVQDKPSKYALQHE